MKYTLINRNKSIITKSNDEFVSWMRKNDLQEWDTNEEFMHAYSHRKKTFEQILLRSNNVDVFVEDLQKNNLLKIEEKESPKIWGFLKI